MREIKFRAWNSYQKKMHDWAAIGEADEHNYLSLWNLLIGEVENIIPLQFTGLKDKNGKEVYEGDICSQKYYSRPVVITFEDGGFMAEDVYLGDPSLEVIGNIYENPELLK